MQHVVELAFQRTLDRWSGGGGLTDGSSGGGGGGGGLDEEVGLLHGAAEVPFESPLPYRSSSSQQHQHSSSDCNINSPGGGGSGSYQVDSTQLQRTINRTFAADQASSSMLSSETTATTAVSPNQKKETTIC